MTAMPLLPGMSSMGHESTTMDAAAEVEQLRSAPGPFGRAFIKMMFAHHQMAIDAAQMALHQATHSEINEMAQDIIDSQQREIDQLNQWDQLWYGTIPADGTATP
ncbi:hypothetical protein TFLX_03760 [Thermoflexales bacterium]|nr:hypothetical protein TFLX_03760 [Thermoflexales bacterium]